MESLRLARSAPSPLTPMLAHRLSTATARLRITRSPESSDFPRLTARAWPRGQVTAAASQNWVWSIPKLSLLWSAAGKEEEEKRSSGSGNRSVGMGDRRGGCGGDDWMDGYDAASVEAVVFDQKLFSGFLRRVSVKEAKVFEKMSYLGSLAYDIPKIKRSKLWKRHGLRFVTSSLHKKAKLSHDAEPEEEFEKQEENGDEISTNTAMKSVLAMVAGGEEMKQAVAGGPSSLRNLPCEWFACDNNKTCTRYFAIEGSRKVSAWQTNLLFEPIKFEGFDVSVHRGVYEAAKGIYEQMLPEVRFHLKSHGKSARFCFTGHSLGGSLSVLINLMLLIRGEVPSTSLLPIVTFGAPCVMCGGDLLLQKLKLPANHVQSVMMHRDIVPRAFSCVYPDHAVEILKAINRNFREHPCFQQQNKHLYDPMGKLLILQPEDKFSPCHPLLPSGTGFYLLGASPKPGNSGWLSKAVWSAFLNCPHPLEILSDISAYGPKSTVVQDHDINSYLKSIRRVIIHELRKQKRDWDHLLLWWLLVSKFASNSTQQVFRSVGMLIQHVLLLIPWPAKWLFLGGPAVVNSII